MMPLCERRSSGPRILLGGWVVMGFGWGAFVHKLDINA